MPSKHTHTMADCTDCTDKASPLPQPDPLEEEDSFASSTTTTHPTADQPDLQCCCGRFECMYLKHNSSVLESVEKDVHTAAKLGQVRLTPIPTYKSDGMPYLARLNHIPIDKNTQATYLSHTHTLSKCCANLH